MLVKVIPADWPAPSFIKAFTTTKMGWGFNTVPPSSIISPEENQALADLLPLPSEPIWLQQKHTNKVIKADPEHKYRIADASYSNTVGTICVVRTADCLPILLCHRDGTRVAAIHAGWRGLAAGIIENTLREADMLGSDCLAWFGPAIGPEKFEVGFDVYSVFTQHSQEAKSAFKPIAEDKWLANLYLLAQLRLKQLNVMDIYGGKFCTYSQSDLFFSYRRDNKNTGRMASLIWINTI